MFKIIGVLAGILAFISYIPYIKDILTKKPVATPVPTPTPPPPLEPEYHPHAYGLEIGGHYIYETFKGPDFNAQESGPFLGDVRAGFKSPFSGTHDWRGEVEFQRVKVQPTDPSTVPFQSSATNYSLRLTAIKETPYKDQASLGIVVLNEYSLFQRAGYEALEVDFPILAGPCIDWRHNYQFHEVHYRVGAYLGSTFALEGSAAYTFLLPVSDGLTTTASFELRGVGGVTTNTSLWTSGTGFFFLGVRW